MPGDKPRPAGHRPRFMAQVSKHTKAGRDSAAQRVRSDEVLKWFDSTWLASHEFDPYDRPGLFGFAIGEESWEEFGLGPAPDNGLNVWVYVGRAQRATATWRWRENVVSVNSSGSTFRRTLIALLHERYGWEVIPREVGNQADFQRYRLFEHDEHALNEWIAEHVIIAEWPPGASEVHQTLGAWHGDVLAVAKPPFNLTGCLGSYTDAIRARRRACMKIAEEWAVGRGLARATSPWAPTP
jgi:hypothetical protein